MKGIIRTSCTAYRVHPDEMDAAMHTLCDNEFDDFEADNCTDLTAGEAVMLAGDLNPGEIIHVIDHRGDELWIDERFIQWEGQS